MNIQIFIALIAIIPALITAFLAIFSTFSSTSQPHRGKPIDLSEYKHLKVKDIKRVALEETSGQKFKKRILLGLIFYSFFTVFGILSIAFILGTILFQSNIDTGFLTYIIKSVSIYISFNILSTIYIIIAIIGVILFSVQVKVNWRIHKYMERDAGQAEKDTRHFLFENACITFELDSLIITANTLSALKLMKAAVIELYRSTSPEQNVLHAYLGSKPPLTKKLTICIKPKGNTCTLHVTYPDTSKPGVLGLADYYEDAAEILNQFIALVVLDLNKV